MELPPVEPTGGRWSGTWVDADIYYRSNIGVSGTQTLAHTYYEPTSCPVAEITTIGLLQGPIPSPSISNILCTAQAPIVMTSFPASATWFGLADGNILDPAQFTGGMIACEMTDATNVTCATFDRPHRSVELTASGDHGSRPLLCGCRTAEHHGTGRAPTGCGVERCHRRSIAIPSPLRPFCGARCLRGDHDRDPGWTEPVCEQRYVGDRGDERPPGSRSCPR